MDVTEIVVVSVEVDTRPPRPIDRVRRALLVEAARAGDVAVRVVKAATRPEVRKATARGAKAGIVAMCAAVLALAVWWLANLAATALTVVALAAGTPGVLWAATRTGGRATPTPPTRRDKPVRVTATATNIPRRLAIEGRRAITARPH